MNTIASRLLLGAVAATQLVAQPARSQSNQPVAFVHGFMGDASDWAFTVPALVSLLHIQPSTPGLASFSSYETQAQSLLAQTTGHTVLVGHSNGGIVSRLAGQVREQDGVLTLGSPHRGVPLVTNYDLIGWYASGLVTDISYAAWVFCCMFSYYNDWGYWLAAEAVFLGPAAFITTLEDLVDAYIIPSLPVVSQMAHNSSFWSNVLNASSALTAESDSIASRVGITFVTDNYLFGGPWKNFNPPETAETIASDINVAVAYLGWLGEYLVNTADPDPEAQMQSYEEAFALWGIALHLSGIDLYWCDLINGGGGYCGPSDEVVPAWSQEYPGATNSVVVGPLTHGDEPADVNTIRDVLRDNFGIVPR